MRSAAYKAAVVATLAGAWSAWSATGSKPLLEAARRGDGEAIRSLVKSGVDVNAAEGDGATALHWASYHDDAESAALLLKAGAKADAVNDLGATPLWMACQNRNPRMVKLLLEAGANPNAALQSGETLVMTAARAGDPDVVEQLLSKGADPNARATRGQTALMWAVAQHQLGAIRSLLAHHADVQARTETWTQVWQTGPDQDIHPDYHVTMRHGGDTALLFAARNGDLEAAKLLVAAGANVNDMAADGTTATILAAHSGNGELVGFFLGRDADPNASKAGYTALHAAILRRNTRAVRALLAHGANPNAKLMVSTPVRRSSIDFYFHPAFVGATPFWLAARFLQPDVMRMLAQHGADPLYVHYVDYWGTKLSTSKYRRETPGATTALMAALGLGRGAGFAPPPQEGREQRTLEAVKLAAELGVNVHAADADGRTALETATALGYRSVVDFLVGKGAKLDRPVRPLKKDAVDN